MEKYLKHLSFLNGISFLVHAPIMFATTLKKEYLLESARAFLIKTLISANKKDSQPSFLRTEEQYFITDHLNIVVLTEKGEEEIELPIFATVCVPPKVSYYFKVHEGYPQGVLHTFNNQKGY